MPNFEIDGLAEFKRNLAKINRGTERAVRRGVRRAAKPAAQRAQEFAVRDITNIGPRWSRIRIGGGTTDLYLAPRQRNSGGRPRPNLSGLLFKAMAMGVFDKRKEFLRNVEKEMDILKRSAGF